MRRSHMPAESVLAVDDLKLDRVEHRVERAGRRIELTSKEFCLLEYLMRNAGRRITRNMIIEHVWKVPYDTSTNLVDVYVSYLRRKVDDGFGKRLIHTIRGAGYELSARSSPDPVAGPGCTLGFKTMKQPTLRLFPPLPDCGPRPQKYHDERHGWDEPG